ncbi:MAG: hypothetical protein GY838_03460 [bacterium]|nr:hypothetical protein [bacterium]
MEFVREILFVSVATAAMSGTALGAAWGLRRQSAALRSRILTAAFVVGLLLPVLLPMLPAPRVVTTGSPPATAPGPAAATAIQPAPGDAGRTTSPGLDPATLLALAAGVWILGCGMSAARLAFAHRRAHRLAGGANPLTSGPVAQLYGTILTDQGLPPTIGLAVSDRTTTPLTVGWRHPLVVLPRAAVRWPLAELAAVLRHELAHVQRRDNAVALAAGVLACLHWFDPLVWWALRSWRRQSELACDDAVVRWGVRPSAYARVLLDRARPDTTVPALAVAPFAAHVRGRLNGLLDARTDRSASRRRAGFLAAAVLLALVLPLTALRPAVFANPAVLVDPLALEPPVAPARPGSGSSSTPGWWRELTAEMDELRAVNRWRRDPTRGTPLPEGILAGDGWTLEAHHAVVLPGTKFGCIFTSDDGYVRVSYADGERFGLSAFTHPPLDKFERTLDGLLKPLDLDTGGDPRAYHIEGWRNDRFVQRFRGVLNDAVVTTRSESP